MKNKQDWRKEFDKYANKLKINSRIYNGEDYCALCGTNPTSLKEFIQKQITKAKEEAVKEVLSLPKQDYKPVFGLSNRKFIFVDNIERYLKSLEDKK